MSDTILIIEDDPPTCKLWERHLVYAGWETQSVHNATEAEIALLKYQPKAVILDVMLDDEQSGWEVLAKLRSWNWGKELPVFVVSAVEAPQRAVREGATAFLLKPCSPQLIVSKVRDYLIPESATPE